MAQAAPDCPRAAAERWGADEKGFREAMAQVQAETASLQQGRGKRQLSPASADAFVDTVARDLVDEVALDVIFEVHRCERMHSWITDPVVSGVGAGAAAAKAARAYHAKRKQREELKLSRTPGTPPAAGVTKKKPKYLQKKTKKAVSSTVATTGTTTAKHVDVFGQSTVHTTPEPVSCPHCAKLVGASRFAPHLQNCLGLSQARVTHKRK